MQEGVKGMIEEEHCSPKHMSWQQLLVEKSLYVTMRKMARRGPKQTLDSVWEDYVSHGIRSKGDKRCSETSQVIQVLPVEPIPNSPATPTALSMVSHTITQPTPTKISPFALSFATSLAKSPSSMSTLSMETSTESIGTAIDQVLETIDATILLPDSPLFPTVDIGTDNSSLVGVKDTGRLNTTLVSSKGHNGDLNGDVYIYLCLD